MKHMKIKVIYTATTEVELEVDKDWNANQILEYANETPIPVNKMEDAEWKATKFVVPLKKKG